MYVNSLNFQVYVQLTVALSFDSYDLMHQVNVRGTFLTSKYCIPHLKASQYGGRILNNSPPLVSIRKYE